jgi:hypothetical protein
LFADALARQSEARTAVLIATSAVISAAARTAIRDGARTCAAKLGDGVRQCEAEQTGIGELRWLDDARPALAPSKKKGWCASGATGQ